MYVNMSANNPPSELDLASGVILLVNIVNTSPQPHRPSSINTFSRLVSVLMDLMQKTYRPHSIGHTLSHFIYPCLLFKSWILTQNSARSHSAQIELKLFVPT